MSPDGEPEGGRWNYDQDNRQPPPRRVRMLAEDRWMSHSVLSAPINLGLLHPLEIAERVVRAYHEGAARLSSVEGFLRQVVGWRDYVWHIYWYAGEGYREADALD